MTDKNTCPQPCKLYKKLSTQTMMRWAELVIENTRLNDGKEEELYFTPLTTARKPDLDWYDEHQGG